MTEGALSLNALVRDLDELFSVREWYTRTKPRDKAESEWAAGNRAACKAYAESSNMALLGFSHAATEYLVMKMQMADYFRTKGVKAVCLEQSDWWR